MSEEDSGTLDPIVKEAQDRFKIVSERERTTRQYFLDDMKFGNADSYNGWQWPNEIYGERGKDKKPCLTINKVRQHNLQIINDAKQNKPGIAIRAVGNGATFESAQALECVIRYIERKSHATVAYDTATTFQVYGGIGYLRVATNYCDQDSFNQDIFIRRCIDPLAIYLDPDAKEADKSDMLYAFVYDDLPKKEFENKYANYKEYGTQSPLGRGDDLGWIEEDKIRVCEYFRKVEKKEKMIAIQTAFGMSIVKGEELKQEKYKTAVDDPQTLMREIVTTEVEWFLIIGEKIAERKKWPGKYIPIVPVIGEETIIDGELDRKGHTRAMHDPQRMYNYWTSSATEHVALQGKTPWIASADAIEGYEVYYNTANRENYSVLMYNAYDDSGNKLEAPERAQPPTMAPAYVQGMQIASDEVMSVSGQYQPQMGEPGNERSAKAIDARQRQGDNSTYHYIDNLAIAVRHVGEIILDLIPKIYDTERVLQIMAEDGTSFELVMDPQQQDAFQKRLDHNNQVVQRILNPNVGKYEVDVDTGPAYATKREEAFNAFTLILTQAPQLASIIGDLLLQAGDFPMADQAAERLRRMVPPQALGQGPSMTEQQLTEQVEQLKGLLAKALEENAMNLMKLKGKDQLRDIDAFNAVTTRLKAEWDYLVKIGVAVISPMQLAGLVKDTMTEAQTIGLEPAVNAALPGLQAAAQSGLGAPQAQLEMGFLEKAPVPGARKGANGQWFMPQPEESSRYAPMA